MSGHYPWPKDPEGYTQERPTASPDHQALNALAGPGRWRWRRQAFGGAPEWKSADRDITFSKAAINQ